MTAPDFIEMTLAQWKARHRDMKACIAGVRVVMLTVPGVGPCMVPVKIVREKTGP